MIGCCCPISIATLHHLFGLNARAYESITELHYWQNIAYLVLNFLGKVLVTTLEVNIPLVGKGRGYKLAMLLQ